MALPALCEERGGGRGEGGRGGREVEGGGRERGREGGGRGRRLVHVVQGTD